MKINYCLPILNTTKARVYSLINSNKQIYSHFEVWLEYIDNADANFVKSLCKNLGKRLILVTRRKNLEKPRIALRSRIHILSIAKRTGTLVDLDFTTQKPELVTLKKEGVKLILSYHNYEHTPSRARLREIIAAMVKHKPFIYKLSSFCKTHADAVRLLELQLELACQKKRHIIIGMGNFGSSTRILGALWGNEMTFAPLKIKKASAPGQLTRSQLNNIFQFF